MNVKFYIHHNNFDKFMNGEPTQVRSATDKNTVEINANADEVKLINYNPMIDVCHAHRIITKPSYIKE